MVTLKMRSTHNNPYPKMSIVTPSLNQVATLEKTILSVLNQNYPNLEYIIMDGGSTDGSVEIIRKYEDKLSFWQSKPDKGQAQALNEGFSRCTGEICAWLNADDFYYPGALLKVMEGFTSFPYAGLIFGDAVIFSVQDKPICKIVPKYINRRLMSINCFIRQPSVFFRKCILEKTGLLDESYINSFDYDFWIRTFSMTVYKYIPFVFSGSRVGAESKTIKYWNRSLKEKDIIQKKYFGIRSWKTELEIIASQSSGYLPFKMGNQPALQLRVKALIIFFSVAFSHPIYFLRQFYAAVYYFVLDKAFRIRIREIIDWDTLSLDRS
jgi:glycosyltransferase involved in cell wall biosynthesis